MFTFLFHIVPLFWAWVYAAFAVWYAVKHIGRVKAGTKSSIRQWAIGIFSGLYAVTFVITFVFFHDFWESTFSIIGLASIAISYAWTHYEDRCNGKRGWNW